MAVGAFREIERSYFDLRWHLDPVAASQAGLTAYDGQFGHYSAESMRAHLVALKSLAAALEEAAVGDLEEEIDRTALLNDARSTIQRYEKEQPQRRNPEFWLSHALSGLHVLLRPGDRTAEERGRAVVERLEGIGALLDEAQGTIVDPPAVFVDTARAVVPGGLTLVREVAFEAQAGNPGLAERLSAAATAAQEALTGYLVALDRWRGGAEANGFALGEELFNHRLHYEHALRDTAPELWRYGHHLVDEVEADLAQRAGRFGAPWSEVIDRLRAEHPVTDELLGTYERAMLDARAFVVERGLAAIPDAPLSVIPTPEFMRPLVPFAAYDPPGAYARDRTGWFYVTLPDPRLPEEERERVLQDHCRHEFAATALHEGYPGHHLQIGHALNLASETRRNVWSPLTVEGWALYCEDLMAEQGFYRTEEERLFQRMHLLWRAVRVLLDVGLHTRGMTIEEAVGLLESRLHIERANAEAEVRRYCAWPTYQLCYATGRRELLRLRDDFRAARGDAYSLRAFHDAVLSYGGLPVSLARWGLGLGE